MCCLELLVAGISRYSTPSSCSSSESSNENAVGLGHIDRELVCNGQSSRGARLLLPSLEAELSAREPRTIGGSGLGASPSAWIAGTRRNALELMRPC